MSKGFAALCHIKRRCERCGHLAKQEQPVRPYPHTRPPTAQLPVASMRAISVLPFFVDMLGRWSCVSSNPLPPETRGVTLLSLP